MSSSTCAICHHPVRYVLTVAGKRIPCDPTVTEDGVIVLAAVGHTVRARVLDGKQLPWQGDTGPRVGPFMPHERTCGRAGRAARQPSCRDCGYELQPIIVARAGTLHWLCGGVGRPVEVVPAVGPVGPVQTSLAVAS